MALVTAVMAPGNQRTWTVLGADYLPIDAAEEFLEFLRTDGFSPNTVRSYAQSLGEYFQFLELAEATWRDVTISLFAAFRRWLATGTAPGTVMLHSDEAMRSPATVDLRCAAVLSFYRFHYEEHGEECALRLYRVGGRDRGDGGHRELLAHLRRYRRNELRPVFRTRRAAPRLAPIFTPDQVQTVLDGCATFSDGAWHGSVRDRLLFATLHETGMRLGECLGLQHRDFVTGAGGTPYIEIVPRDDHPHGARVKGGHPRRLYISDDLERLYGEYLWQLCDLGAAEVHPPLDEWWVFVNVNRGEPFAPLRPESVYAKVGQLSRRFGESLPEGWTPHWFRHTHATSLLLAGAPIHVVMRRLGHRHVQTTIDRYGWVTEDAELKVLADWRAHAASWQRAEAATS